MADSISNFDDDDSYVQHGPMRDLALRMSEIDKQLDELTSSSLGLDHADDEGKSNTRDSFGSTGSAKTVTASNGKKVKKPSKNGSFVGGTIPEDGTATVTETFTYGQNGSGGMMMSTFDDSRFSVFSDFELDGDDLASLQGELAAFEKMEITTKAANNAASTAEVNGTSNGTTNEQQSPKKKRIVEETISAMIRKPTPESPIGISMKTVKRITRIVAIAEDGLLADTKLKPGLELIEINGVVIRNAKHARYLIQNSKDELTLVGQKVREE